MVYGKDLVELLRIINVARFPAGLPGIPRVFKTTNEESLTLEIYPPTGDDGDINAYHVSWNGNTITQHTEGIYEESETLLQYQYLA